MYILQKKLQAQLGLFLILAIYLILRFVIRLEHHDWDIIRTFKSDAQLFEPVCSNIADSSYSIYLGIVGSIFKVLVTISGDISIVAVFFFAAIHSELVSNFKTHLEQFDLLLHPNTV